MAQRCIAVESGLHGLTLVSSSDNPAEVAGLLFSVIHYGVEWWPVHSVNELELTIHSALSQRKEKQDGKAA